MSRPTALYRWFDQDGRLLYVGITGTLAERTTAHSGTDDWWREVRRADVEWFDTAAEALAAERVAIQQESPRFNRSRPRVHGHLVSRPKSRGPLERRLVELLLRMPFDDYAAPRRAAGMSYDNIAYELTAWLRALSVEVGLPADVSIGGEALRRWASAGVSAPDPV